MLKVHKDISFQVEERIKINPPFIKGLYKNAIDKLPFLEHFKNYVEDSVEDSLPSRAFIWKLNNL